MEDWVVHSAFLDLLHVLFLFPIYWLFYRLWSLEHSLSAVGRNVFYHILWMIIFTSYRHRYVILQFNILLNVLLVVLLLQEGWLWPFIFFLLFLFFFFFFSYLRGDQEISETQTRSICGSHCTLMATVALIILSGKISDCFTVDSSYTVDK